MHESCIVYLWRMINFSARLRRLEVTHSIDWLALPKSRTCPELIKTAEKMRESVAWHIRAFRLPLWHELRAMSVAWDLKYYAQRECTRQTATDLLENIIVRNRNCKLKIYTAPTKAKKPSIKYVTLEGVKWPISRCDRVWQEKGVKIMERHTFQIFYTYETWNRK